jgi:hypothetical protein
MHRLPLIGGSFELFIPALAVAGDTARLLISPGRVLKGWKYFIIAFRRPPQLATYAPMAGESRCHKRGYTCMLMGFE